MVRLVFTAYDQTDGRPVEVYVMSFDMSLNNAAYLNRLIEDLYTGGMTQDEMFYHVNLN